MRTEPSDLKGVHGWLAFLVICLSGLAPLRTLFEVNRSLDEAVKATPQLESHPAWQTYTTFSWFLAVSGIALLVSAGYRLLKHHVPGSPRFAIAVMWGVGQGTPLVDAFGASYIFEIPPSQLGWAPIVGAMFQSVISSSIWTAYLLKSVRVENTYRQRVYGE